MGWKLKGTIIHSDYAIAVGKQVDDNVYGESITDIIEDAEGRMWAFDDRENSATQINFNPFTGEPAKTPIKKDR